MPSNDLQLTAHQQEALRRIKDFLDHSNDDVFVLKGYAGTGKTTLINYILDELGKRNKDYKLAAPTGRAVRVLSEKLNMKKAAYPFFLLVQDGLLVDTAPLDEFMAETINTVHGHIYTPLGVNYNDEETKVSDTERNLFNASLLDFIDNIRAHKNIIIPDNIRRKLKEDHNNYKLFFGILQYDQSIVVIVDEASMIADHSQQEETSQAIFGTGRLLSDLFTAFPKGRFIFIGDDAQLPPVGSSHSVALDARYMEEEHGKSVQTYEMTEIVRAYRHNDIIKAATMLRLQINDRKKPPKFYLAGLQNLVHLPIQRNLEVYLQKIDNALKHHGLEKGLFQALRQNILITLTNKKVHAFNRFIRQHIFGANTPELQLYDILMVTQNQVTSDLNNGDFVQVIALGPQTRKADLHFREIKVRRLSDDRSFSTLIIEDILGSDYSNISHVQYKELMRDLIIRLAQAGKFKNKNDEERQQIIMEATKDDPYINALRAIHGYTVTCHKAQGGEWDEVHILIDKIIYGNSFRRPYNWVYTALTRAKHYAYISSEAKVEPFGKVEAFLCERYPELCHDKH